MITTDLSPEARRKRRREAITESVDLALYDAEKDAADAWAQVDLAKKEIERLRNEVQDARVLAITQKGRIVAKLREWGSEWAADKIDKGEHET